MTKNVGTAALLLTLVCTNAALAQTTSFDIEWRTLAVAYSNVAGQRPKLERTYARLPAQKSSSLRIERVSATPEVIHLQPGQNFCLSSLNITAINPAGERVSGVGVSVDVRADDLPGLRLIPNKHDVCFKPAAAGEYAVRFTSLVPARDNTSRGAQMFIRVQPVAR